MIGLDMDVKGEMLPLEKNIGQPLGLFADPEIHEGSVVLPPGGWLWLYTDGVKEAMDAEGRMFSLEPLQEASQAGGHHSAQEVCDMAWEALERHRGELDQHDDATLVAIRMNPDA